MKWPICYAFVLVQLKSGIKMLHFVYPVLLYKQGFWITTMVKMMQLQWWNCWDLEKQYGVATVMILFFEESKIKTMILNVDYNSYVMLFSLLADVPNSI
jgi:hypothetical protein